MYLGGIAGLATAFFYERSCAAAGTTPVPALCLLLSFLAAFAAAALGGLLFSFLTITLRANQNVTGLTLTIFGGGVANFFGGSLNSMAGGVGQISVAATSAAYRANIANQADLGVFGSLFLSYGFMAYLAILVAIVLWYFLNRTRTGLNLRAVGENPATADAATMDYIKGTWSTDGTIESLGWLAVALVIFATWKPLMAILGAYIFGCLTWLYFYIPNLTRSSQELFKMIPYLVTIAVLILVSLRKKRENQPPAHLGLPYFREER